jgi:hypothetical protein
VTLDVVSRHPSYAYEKLLISVDFLATGAGDIRERLFLVFQDLCFLAEADFPDHLRSDWLWIVNQMTRTHFINARSRRSRIIEKAR